MKRIFLKNEISENIIISGDEARHLAYSLRARKGDRIIVVDNSSNSATIELVDFDKERIFAKCVSEIKKVNSSETIRIIHRVGKSNDEIESHIKTHEKIFTKHVTLAECLPKQNKFDFVVEKATELGTDKIMPLISDRTIARPDNIRAKTKLERWNRIAKETSEQCARDVLPEIENIYELGDWLKKIEPNLGKFIGGKFNCEGELLLFCNEREQDETVQNILHEYRNSDCNKNIIILIGPEGGFSDREVREIKSVGGVSVSLGKRIFKTDTAAIATLAIVQYELS